MTTAHLRQSCTDAIDRIPKPTREHNDAGRLSDRSAAPRQAIPSIPLRGRRRTRHRLLAWRRGGRVVCFRRARRHMAERVSRRGRRIGPRGNRRATRSVRTPVADPTRYRSHRSKRCSASALPRSTPILAHTAGNATGDSTATSRAPRRTTTSGSGWRNARCTRAGGRRRGRVEHALPDDDERVDLDLVLWTFEESEPWIEVFSDGGRYSVIQRIT